MPFLKFFWREFKSDKSFNWLYVLCASLGILGLLLVESFRIGIENKVSGNAKKFIASDFSISTRRSFSASELSIIKNYLHDKKLNYAEWIETYSLVSRDTSVSQLSRLANLNFVTTEFPFYGGVELENKVMKGPGHWDKLHETPSAWVSRDLAWELQAKVGDELKIGEMKFVVQGIIISDQFSSFRGFNLAPKVFLSHHFLKQTELIKFGSTATFSYSIKLPPNISYKVYQNELRTLIPDKSIKINGPEESSQQISRSLNMLTDYLSLITLMTYLLSLVGLYYFTQHFLSKKLKTFSIYKALGVKTSYLFKINFLQLVLLSFVAILFSTIVVTSALPTLQNIFTKFVGEELVFRLNAFALIRILMLSLCGSLLALGPLFWGALQTPVATIFQDLPFELKRIHKFYFLPLLIYIILLAVFLANSIKVGGYFLGALAGIIILSALFFKLITKLLEQVSERLSFINKHAAKTLSRYFASSFTIFICLLMGMTLTTFIFQIENSLRAEFTQTHGDRRPDLFMFDLQDTQAQSFESIVKTENWNRTMFSPMIRGRLIKINDVLSVKREEPGEQNFATREDQNASMMRNRGVNLSYRSTLSWSETLVKGKFNGEKCNPELKLCEISLEQSYARRLGAKIGDKLIFDVSGIEVQGVVTSMRTVKWTSFEPNFFILFQPGVLEEAPKTYLAAIKVKSINEKREVFAKIAESFPSVSILEVSELVKKIVTIFDLMAMAIKFISILSLFVALVVLSAISFNHLELRKKEMGLFFMMGLKSNVIKTIYTREFSFLIFICVLLSLVFGSALTTIIMKFVFNSEAFLRLGFCMPTMIGLGGLLYFIVKLRVQNLLKNKSHF